MLQLRLKFGAKVVCPTTTQRTTHSTYSKLTRLHLIFLITGLDARGSRNIIRYNTIENNKGAAVRLGGHTIVRPNPETGEDEEETYGINNEVYHNLISNNEFAAVKVEVRMKGVVRQFINEL